MLAMSVAGALATSAAWAGDDDDGGSGGSGSSGSDDDDDNGDDGGGSGGSGSGSGSSGSGDDDDGGSGSSGSGGGDRDDRDDRDDDRGRGRGGDDERRDDDAEEPDDTDDRSGRGRGRGRSGDDAARATAVPSVPGVLPEPGGSGGERESLSDALLAANLTRAELDAARAAGFRIRVGRELPNLRLVVARLTPPPGVPAGEAALRLRALAPARAVDLDTAYTLQAGACVGEACWGHELVGWSAAAAACRTGRRIGMVDTGVETAEPALAKAAMQVRPVLPEGLREAPAAHGTAIATLLVGRADAAASGLLPDAELRVAAVFGQRSGRPVTGALEIATALDWLVAERVEVVNAALAGPPNGILELAVARVLRLGIPIVAAAGNAGPDAPPAYPAAYPGVLAVTAVDRTLSVYPRANRGAYVAFAAPGVDLPLPAADGAARTVSGTSYATAFVTAAVAGLGRSADLEAQLARAALDLGPPGRDPVFGWGLVRPAACRG
jgi:hypothetical protein